MPSSPPMSSPYALIPRNASHAVSMESTKRREFAVEAVAEAAVQRYSEI